MLHDVVDSTSHTSASPANVAGAVALPFLRHHDRSPCACGVAYAYVPAGKRAEEAFIRNPEKSDRSIAEEIGVNHNTVTRARKKTTVSYGTVELKRLGKLYGKRIGKDGKARKLPQAKIVEAETNDPEPVKPSPTAPVTAAVEPSSARRTFMLLDDLLAALTDPRNDIRKTIDAVGSGRILQNHRPAGGCTRPAHRREHGQGRGRSR